MPNGLAPICRPSSISLEEADHWAGEEAGDVVTGAHVQQAIDAQIYRSDRIRERLQEEVLRETILIDTEGAVVGQINGLAVLGMGNFAFGKAPHYGHCPAGPGRSGGHRTRGGAGRSAPLQGRADSIQLSACQVCSRGTVFSGRQPGL